MHEIYDNQLERHETKTEAMLHRSKTEIITGIRKTRDQQVRNNDEIKNDYNKLNARVSKTNLGIGALAITGAAVVAEHRYNQWNAEQIAKSKKGK